MVRFLNFERRNKYMGQGSSVIKTNKRLDINLDLRTLDIMCKALVTDNQTVRRGKLINLRNLIFLLNPTTYENDLEKSKRISFIKKGIEARLEYNITDPFMIMTHIYGGILDSDIVDMDEFRGLTGAEIAWLNNMVS